MNIHLQGVPFFPFQTDSLITASFLWTILNFYSIEFQTNERENSEGRYYHGNFRTTECNIIVKLMISQQEYQLVWIMFVPLSLNIRVLFRSLCSTGV